MSPEQLVALISALTGLAGVVVGFAGVWLARQARSLGLQEALHQKQLEGALLLIEGVVKIQNGLLRLDIARNPQSSLADEFDIEHEREEVAFRKTVLTEAMALQRWRAILPAQVVEATDQYLQAVTGERSDGQTSNRTTEKYLVLLTALRKELGIDPLTSLTTKLMREGLQDPQPKKGVLEPVLALKPSTRATTA